MFGIGRRNTLEKSPYRIGELNGRERYIFGGERPRNIDHLPFAAWDLLEEDVYGNNLLDWYINVPVWGDSANNSSATPFKMKRSLTTVSSRGCPYACAFCYRGAQGERNYRMRSAKSLRGEVEWLLKTYDLDFVGFPDDNFAVDKRRINLLPEAFQGLIFRWGTHTRLDEADERLENMAAAGCVYIGFGAESAAVRTLTRMQKGGFILRRGLTDVNGFKFPVTMYEGIKKCKEVGIHANCTWIMGYPGETLDDLKTSVGFIMWQEELNAGSPSIELSKSKYSRQSVNRNMFTATAYPGTEMFKEPIVQERLATCFGMDFDPIGQPIINDKYRNYIYELDDATKVLRDENENLLYFGAMNLDKFVEARAYVDNGQIEKILQM